MLDEFGDGLAAGDGVEFVHGSSGVGLDGVGAQARQLGHLPCGQTPGIPAQDLGLPGGQVHTPVVSVFCSIGRCEPFVRQAGGIETGVGRVLVPCQSVRDSDGGGPDASQTALGDDALRAGLCGVAGGRSIGNAVIMRTGMSPSRSRMRRQASMPDMSDRDTSISSTSGLVRPSRHRDTARRPDRQRQATASRPNAPAREEDSGLATMY